jgi:hypothetical protein
MFWFDIASIFQLNIRSFFTCHESYVRSQCSNSYFDGFNILTFSHSADSIPVSSLFQLNNLPALIIHSVDLFSKHPKHM